jgi:hypothetical protein
MTRYILVLLLLGHGGIVAAQAGDVPHSWLVGDSHGLGIMLALAAGAVFLLAAVELWMRGALASARRHGCRPLPLFLPRLLPAGDPCRCGLRRCRDRRARLAEVALAVDCRSVTAPVP